MPDKAEESEKQDIAPAEPATPKEHKKDLFRQVLHRTSVNGKTIDTSGMETHIRDASIDLEEIFSDEIEMPTVYFETSSGTIYKLSRGTDNEGATTLILERSNKPNGSMWVDPAGQIGVGDEFQRITRKKGENTLTSIETGRVKRIAVFEHQGLIPSPEIERTDIIDRFEQCLIAAGGKLP